MSEVIIAGKRRRYSLSDSVGKGGEADVFNLGDGTVLKLWKSVDHPDIAGDPMACKVATQRLQEQRTKLPALLALAPRLPSAVVAPIAVATDRTGAIVGYTMPFLAGGEVLLRYSQQDFRANVSTDEAIAMLRKLHKVTSEVHQAGVVIGDFNDLNGMVLNGDVHLFDFDSAQHGPFKCRTFTTTFVDPMLCDPAAKVPVLVSPHGVMSDWYAFTVMAMQTLLFVGPYGGIYVSPDPKRPVIHGRRPLVRATVFRPEVRYPKPAVPLNRLPDDLLHHFTDVFEKDYRVVFPSRLLEQLRWTTCSGCGAQHGRAVCPACSKQAPAALKTTTRVRGHVTATRVFPGGAQMGAKIVRAEVQAEKMLWLYQEGGILKRGAPHEAGAQAKKVDEDYAVGAMSIEPSTRFWLREGDTFIGQGSRVVALAKNTVVDTVVYSVDTTAGFPTFALGATDAFWTHQGMLLFDKGTRGKEQVRVGDVLSGQTILWMGPTFGFGFCPWAGSLSLAFVFEAGASSLNDNFKVPPITGKLIDATCAFTKDRVWFLTSSQEGADRVNRCTVIRRNGTVEATAHAIHGDGSWLGQIRGAAATKSVLLVPTDDGIVQAKIEGGMIVESERFPDTEPFVDSTTKLCVADDGLYAVSQHEIVKITIARKA